MDTATPTTGREYLRVSRDQSGRQRSVEEQHQDNQQHARQRGVELAAPYAEPKAVSASRYGTKPRGGFAKLVGDLRAGRFAAGELWLWESSRGSRRVAEWVELVEALEGARVKVYVTTHHRLYDPAVPRDRRSLLEDAVDSEYETAKSSERLRRAKAASAAAGRPGRGLGYGWAAVHDPATGARRYVIDPAEAAVVREMFRRMAAGDSLGAISRDLQARGVRTRSGTAWTIQRIRPTLLREAYKAVRVHRPKTGPATRQPATWPAIVEPVLFDRVYAILTGPERKNHRAGRARWLLSLLVVCDVCGNGLVVNYRYKTWCYRCPGPGHVTVPVDALDALAEQVILAYLTRPDVAEQLSAATASTPDLDAARAEMSEVARELDELYAQVSAGRASATALARIEPGLLARQETAQARVRELSAPPALAGILTPGPGARRRWKALPVAAKREVARLLLAPDLLGELRVTRGIRGRRLPVEDRVTFRRAP